MSFSGSGKSLEKFLSALDDNLAEQYRIDRWNSGTTGKGKFALTKSSWGNQPIMKLDAVKAG